MSYSALDVSRLVQIITEEVLRATAPGALAGRCACHDVHAECCPDRLRDVLDAGASRLGLQASGAPAGTVAGLIDHTLLKPDATQAEIETLCREAREYAFATVCLNPTWVPLAARLLRGSPVGVCTVVGFPLGATTADVKQYETRRVIFDGATEVDMVINIGALKSRDYETVFEDICRVVKASAPAGVKVILETSALDTEQKIIGCTLSKLAGAAFVKTSTGFGKGGATVEDIEMMRRIVGTDVGVKASGGVRTAEDALRMAQAGANRLGASASIAIVTGASDGKAKGY
jgi:deoxyribose-phosphate aldolase